MIRVWKLQDAKNRFSEVVECAMREGPQKVQRRGKDAVVIVSAAQYKKMSRPKESLVEFFAKSPLKGVKLDLTRNKDTGRVIDL